MGNDFINEIKALLQTRSVDQQLNVENKKRLKEALTRLNRIIEIFEKQKTLISQEINLVDKIQKYKSR